MSAHPYEHLTPETILAAVETHGVRCTGAFLALNSYENRVYRVEREDGSRVSVKFYRPDRWSAPAILEEHAFATTLAGEEIPVVAPLAGPAGTLGELSGFRFAIFPWAPGRVGEVARREERLLLGRFLGRLHRIGDALGPFSARPHLTVADYAQAALRFVLAGPFVPDYLRTTYADLAQEALGRVAEAFGDFKARRLHGDCHLGNLLWEQDRLHIVDLDDCRMGPAVQDLWMLLSGPRAEQEHQLAELLEGYTQFCAFDAGELSLIEPLRTLRIVHYAGWLARRWDDPAFPRAFPWFAGPRYWEEQVLSMREQLAAMQEPPLRWSGA